MACLACICSSQRHLLKILGAQDIIGGRGESCVKLQHFRLFPAALRFILVEHGFRQPAKARILGLFVGRRGRSAGNMSCISCSSIFGFFQKTWNA